MSWQETRRITKNAQKLKFGGGAPTRKIRGTYCLSYASELELGSGRKCFLAMLVVLAKMRIFWPKYRFGELTNFLVKKCWIHTATLKTKTKKMRDRWKNPKSAQYSPYVQLFIGVVYGPVQGETVLLPRSIPVKGN